MAPPLPWPSLDPIPAGWLGDTPAQAVARWRCLTPADRYAAFRRTRVTAYTFALAGERMRHPDLPPDALHARARRRMADAGV